MFAICSPRISQWQSALPMQKPTYVIFFCCNFFLFLVSKTVTAKQCEFQGLLSDFLKSVTIILHYYSGTVLWVNGKKRINIQNLLITLQYVHYRYTSSVNSKYTSSEMILSAYVSQLLYYSTNVNGSMQQQPFQFAKSSKNTQTKKRGLYCNLKIYKN